jgi:hypothetical protein
MNRFSTLALALAVSGSVLAGRSAAADKPDGPPANQDGGPRGGPGGEGPRGGGPGGGPGGQPGGAHLIPRFAEEKLALTDDQKKQVADLEKEMKDKLAKILTPEQMKTLAEARPPRGGPGGGGGTDGGPGGGGAGGRAGAGGAGGSAGANGGGGTGGGRTAHPQRPPQ